MKNFSPTFHDFHEQRLTFLTYENTAYHTYIFLMRKITKQGTKIHANLGF